VLITRDGWVKRQKEIKDPSATRLREGDQVLAVLAGSTKASAVFFSNFGTAYTIRILDIPATTGYGEPIQKLFKMRDGESIIAAASLDPRLVGELSGDETHYPQTYGLAATSDGYALTFGLAAFAEPSTRAGRKFARLADGASVVGTELVHGRESVIAVSVKRRAIVCDVREINFLASAGKGVLLMKLADDDSLLAIRAAGSERDGLVVKTSLGGEQKITPARYAATARGGKGHEVMSRGTFMEIASEPVLAPEPFAQGT